MYISKIIERPRGVLKNDLPEWGSDVMALAIRNTGVPYVTLNPGASFRGLHDSLVNFLGNESPQIILCLHEEHAVAIAHGYAKVAGRPLAAILHSNVGLMHGSMAIFNAFCDRVPILILGATGPVDAHKRRPWIDWIHTAQDQGALIRNYVKWDNQPASIQAAVESIYRAAKIAMTAPRGPVYVCFDVTLQEQKLEDKISIPNASRFIIPGAQEPLEQSLSQAVELLRNAKNPLLLAGRVSRDEDAWIARVKLAERLNASVFTDKKTGASFPTAHPLHVAPSVQFLTADDCEIFRSADVILSLDWVDLAGTLRQVWPDHDISPFVINISVDIFAHNGWSMDHQGLPPVDVSLLAEPDVAVPLLLRGLGDQEPSAAAPERHVFSAPAPCDLSLVDVAKTLKSISGDLSISFVRLPGGWPSSVWDFGHPLDFFGFDGGGGIGSGPGMAIGSALAIRDLHPDRVAIAVIGDGDYLMGINAFWTAAHYRIPLLTIVANNRSYFNDEMHQDRVARFRSREPENRWIGQKIIDPEVDLAGLASAQGLQGFGPIKDKEDLHSALLKGVKLVCEGNACVIDVHVAPRVPAVAASEIGRK